METRTNIVLDDALVNQVMARAGVKTKKAAIEAALKAYIRKPDYSAIMALRGTGVLADTYDANEAFSQTPMPALRVADPAPAKRKVAKAWVHLCWSTPRLGWSTCAPPAPSTTWRWAALCRRRTA